MQIVRMTSWFMMKNEHYQQTGERASRKQRLIMQLRDIEGESYKKIATLLNLTEEQVKVNLFRARQKVKQRYLEIDEYGL